MKKKIVITSIVVCILLLVVAIVRLNYNGGNVIENTSVQALAIDTNATAESVSALSNSMNNFCFEIYKQLALGNNENVFLSPYSIFVALSMTYEGARNETAQEMYQVLDFPQNDDVSLCSFGKIYNQLNQKKEYTLRTANALWIKENYPFLPKYLNFIENYYMGKATEVDFNNAKEAVQLINQWVEEITNNKIKDFLKENDIHPLTALILTNAIYFKGDWVVQFDPENTMEKEFKKSSGETIKVPMMSLSTTDFKFNYTENDQMQVLELPYKGNKVSMIAFLPKENNITLLENILSNENFSYLVNNLAPTTVDIILPKFTFETKYLLKEYLMDLGMQIPFDFNADFSGMNGKKSLYIDKVIHQAFIEVNEEGSEAAAATSVHMIESAIPQTVVFNADHPFVFTIYHKESGTILFMGKLISPE